MSDGTISRAEAAALLLQRRTIRRSLLAWCEYALAPLSLAPAAHHLLLIDRLQRVATGEIDRLMVMMPPGSAKSTYASVLFPAWLLAQGNDVQIIGASHTASLAEKFSRDVLNVAREHGPTLGYGLASESAERWSTTRAGRYKSAGIGGPITGTRADFAIIDDPVKSRADAESEVMRNTAWHWYSADLLTRLRPGGRVVLVLTRWHEDDLAGRLLAHEPHRWHVLKLPARAGANDPLGRAPGELLWPGYHTAAMMDDLEASQGARDWAALYQQDPRPGDGGIIRAHMMPTLDAAPAGGVLVRGWDLAATAQSGTADPDWTVGVLMAKYEDGRFVVLDVARDRLPPEGVEAMIVAAAQRDGRGVRVSLPQDPGQAGKAQVLYLTRKLAGYRVDSSPETGDKVERAMPFAAQVNVGNVSVVRANWNAVYRDELGGFPGSRHDDQVDASARAFGALIAPAGPARRLQMAIMGR